jgi:hypothetical protein
MRPEKQCRAEEPGGGIQIPPQKPKRREFFAAIEIVVYPTPRVCY